MNWVCATLSKPLKQQAGAIHKGEGGAYTLGVGSVVSDAVFVGEDDIPEDVDEDDDIALLQYLADQLLANYMHYKRAAVSSAALWRTVQELGVRPKLMLVRKFQRALLDFKMRPNESVAQLLER